MLLKHIGLNLCTPVKQNRKFWQWLVIVFNAVDEERRKRLGPDRVCAEWILRNGGQVKWVGENKYLMNYNLLPNEDVKLVLKEVNASNASISHYGFPHFQGCQHIDSIILDNCPYIEDQAMGALSPIKSTLSKLRISSCRNLTEAGLIQLSVLENLKNLDLIDLPYVKNHEEILKKLQKSLPNCQTTIS